MSSSHYKKLRSGVRELRKHLLPKKFDPSGNYRERVFTSVIAFRVLSHAAIEEYFEARAIEIAQSAMKAFSSQGKISHPAFALLSFSGVPLQAPPETINPAQPGQRATWGKKLYMKEKLSDCVKSFIRRVKIENHGVREKNILSLLLPLGVDPDSIDQLFLSEIDDFGRDRGDFAHSSPLTHTRKKPNPHDELLRVQRLVDQIRPIDQTLNEIFAQTK